MQWYVSTHGFLWPTLQTSPHPLKAIHHLLYVRNVYPPCTPTTLHPRHRRIFFFEVQYCMRIVDRLWFASPPLSSPFLASTHTPLNPQLCLNEGKSTACQCKCLGKASLFLFFFCSPSFFLFFLFFFRKKEGNWTTAHVKRLYIAMLMAAHIQKAPRVEQLHPISAWVHHAVDAKGNRKCDIVGCLSPSFLFFPSFPASLPFRSLSFPTLLSTCYILSRCQFAKQMPTRLRQLW